MTASCNPTNSASTTGGCCTHIVEIVIASCNPTDSASTTGGCCTPIVGIVIVSCNPTDSASTTDTFFPPPPVPENEVMTTSCNPTDSASTTGGCCTPHCVILCILSLFVSAT